MEWFKGKIQESCNSVAVKLSRVKIKSVCLHEERKWKRRGAPPAPRLKELLLSEQRGKSSQKRRINQHQEKLMRQQLWEWRQLQGGPRSHGGHQPSELWEDGRHQCSTGLTGRTGGEALGHRRREEGGGRPTRSAGCECVPSSSETKPTLCSSPCFPGGWTWSWWLWSCPGFWSRGSVGSDPTRTSSRCHPELPSSLQTTNLPSFPMLRSDFWWETSATLTVRQRGVGSHPPHIVDVPLYHLGGKTMCNPSTAGKWWRRPSIQLSTIN